MSATDSDNSIDWLASDNEDSESERETEAPPAPRAMPHLGPSDCDVKKGDRKWREVREPCSVGSPPGRAGTYDNAIGLCRTQGERTNGKNSQQALKRPHSFTEEEEEEKEEERKAQQLISNMTEKDQFFRSKCMDLQCYIHPLSLILNGLRSGRYRERLSSFQESVAMDRIQRIMGVLQNPCMGEKYINIILKMEEMLKSWFPNVKLQNQAAAAHTETAVPTKKSKPSPMTTTTAAATSPVTVSDPPAAATALRVTDLTPGAAYSANNLKWLHTSPICSPAAEQARAGPKHLLSPRDRDLTQDNAVSSSTDTHTKTDAVPRGRPPGKINAPCLERLLKSTESIITRKETRGLMDSSWS